MASITQTNQKLSEIRKVKTTASWPTTKHQNDECWLEHESLLMASEKIAGFNARKFRDISTRFTYGDLFSLIMNLLTTGLRNAYSFSGKFNFATNATDVHCDNAQAPNTPAGREVINYKNLRFWLDNQSGLDTTLNKIGYGDGVNPNY